MALHFRNAWKSLFSGTVVRAVGANPPVEVKVKEVIGKASFVTLYRWVEGYAEIAPGRYLNALSALPRYGYAHSCEQAHEACKGSAVAAVKCIRVGGSYFASTGNLVAIKPLPKPKVAKGR